MIPCEVEYAPPESDFLQTVQNVDDMEKEYFTRYPLFSEDCEIPKCI